MRCDSHQEGSRYCSLHNKTLSPWTFGSMCNASVWDHWGGMVWVERDVLNNGQIGQPFVQIMQDVYHKQACWNEQEVQFFGVFCHTAGCGLDHQAYVVLNTVMHVVLADKQDHLKHKQVAFFKYNSLCEAKVRKQRKRQVGLRSGRYRTRGRKKETDSHKKNRDRKRGREPKWRGKKCVCVCVHVHRQRERER